MSFTQTLRQITSECNFLVSGSSPVPKPNKPNQIFLQGLNNGHIPQTWKKKSTVNDFKLFYVFIYIFSTSSIFQKYCQLDYNTDELIFHIYPSHIHACLRQ